MSKRKSRKQRRRTPTVRVKGLVAFTNRVRQALAQGVPPEEHAHLRQEVQNALRQVEDLCRAHGLTPADLPAPSRRAYEFLRSLDLSAIPTPTDNVPAPPSTVRVQNVRRMQTAMHAALWQLALRETPTPAEALAEECAHHADTIRAILDEAGADVLALAPATRAFYQWLVFLSDSETMREHVETLRRFVRAAESVRPKSRGVFALVRLLPMAHIYRMSPTAEGTHVALHEGFLGAPDEVLKALARVALTGNVRAQDRRCIRDYVQSDEFQETAATVETLELPLVAQPKGSFHDLDAVFDRVNAAYFNGAMPRPRLTWNRQMTHNKMAHYDARRDTVMVSVTLDHPDVPDDVLDFVMYHELLHKQFGVRIVNGRRMAHTPEFRAAERRFARYDEAVAFLKSHARRIM